MPFNPINYGNILAQTEGIQGARMNNALAARQLDPNSTQNQLARAKIEELQAKAQNPAGIASYSKSPTLVRDSNGVIRAFQLSDQGGAQEVYFGDGAAPAIKGEWKDIGNGLQILDPYLGGSQGVQQPRQPQQPHQSGDVNLSDIPTPTLTGSPEPIQGFIPKGVPVQDTPEYRAEQERAVLEVQTEAAAEKKKQEALGVSAAKKAEEGFKLVDGLKTNLFNLNDAMAALDSGAETGPIAQYFPTVRAATVQLLNAQNRVGLDIIGAVTFGALSKGELDLALQTAIPTNLEEPELKKWLRDKIAAQTKLMNYLEEQSIFLSEPGNTQADWAKQRKADPRLDNVMDFSTMSDAELEALAK